VSELLKVESAYCDGKLIGHRVMCGTETLLVFASDAQPVFRIGSRFYPGIGQKIEYVTQNVNQQSEESKS
jgi:hypothetical protein